MPKKLTSDLPELVETHNSSEALRRAGRLADAAATLLNVRTLFMGEALKVLDRSLKDYNEYLEDWTKEKKEIDRICGKRQVEVTKPVR